MIFHKIKNKSIYKFENIFEKIRSLQHVFFFFFFSRKINIEN